MAQCPEDGVIEAIEINADDSVFHVEHPAAKQFVLGVQWHPERSFEISAASRALFGKLVAEARQVAETPCGHGVHRKLGALAAVATLSESRIAELVEPYLEAVPVPEGLYGQLSAYLDLLVKWNARTNLTAIREPEEMVQRHFGESLFAGVQIAGRVSPGASLLDFGSGAGFPGLPIQLLLPELRMTLAESQGKKASFLREAVRTLGVSTEVWAARVEAMPDVAGMPRQFDVVDAAGPSITWSRRWARLGVE